MALYQKKNLTKTHYILYLIITLACGIALFLSSILRKEAVQYEQPKSFVNSVGMVMAKVPGGYHSSRDEYIGSFYIGATEVTNAQYELFQPEHRMKRDKYSYGENHPVVWVSAQDALSYARWLSDIEDLPYSLPTEAQWQWAAQAAGHRFEYATHNGTLSHDLANYSGIGGLDRFKFTAPVGSFPPNPLGLHDMSGNVWEWCIDWYYRKKTWHRVWINLKIFKEIRIPFIWYDFRKKWRVLRGGSYLHDEPLQRINVRNAYRPYIATRSYGFRVALPADSYKRILR